MVPPTFTAAMLAGADASRCGPAVIAARCIYRLDDIRSARAGNVVGIAHVADDDAVAIGRHVGGHARRGRAVGEHDHELAGLNEMRADREPDEAGGSRHEYGHGALQDFERAGYFARRAASYGGRRGGAILQMDAGFACLALCGGAAFNGVDRACSKLRSVIEAKRLDQIDLAEEARRRGVSP